VPLEVAEAAARLGEMLRALASTAPEKFGSDIATAQSLTRAAIEGALANVRINLASMKDESAIAGVRGRLARFQ
jgi:formiminotetrahydrofolate cyclodeaminase